MTSVHCSPRIFQEGRIGSIQYTTDYKNIIHVPTLVEAIHTCSKFYITPTDSGRVIELFPPSFPVCKTRVRMAFMFCSEH